MDEKISVCLEDISKEDWDDIESLREQYNVTWGEFIHQMALYPETTEHALKLPREITSNMVVNVTTLHSLIPVWLNNIHENLESIKNGLDIRDIPKTNLPALIIGAGPSLHRNKHLQLLADTGFDGIIFATDRILKDCIEAGVVPDYVLTLDGSDKILSFFDHEIVDAHADQISAILCVMTHPSVVNRWKGEKYWFTNSIQEDVAPNTAYILHRLLKKTEMTTAGHASSLGWSVAHTIGCREIALIGVDLSYPADTPKEETAFHGRYVEGFGDDTDRIDRCYTTYHHEFFDTDCYYDMVFKSYVDCSMAHFRSAAATRCKIINCTEGGAIEGDGVTCMRFGDYLASRKL